MSLLPAILALGDFKIHICTLDGWNIALNSKQPIDKIFSIKPTLSIPYIDAGNSYISFA